MILIFIENALPSVSDFSGENMKKSSTPAHLGNMCYQSDSATTAAPLSFTSVDLLGLESSGSGSGGRTLEPTVYNCTKGVAEIRSSAKLNKSLSDVIYYSLLNKKEKKLQINAINKKMHF